MAKKINELKVVSRKIAKLIAADYNPRKMSEKQKNELFESIKRYGFIDPVLVPDEAPPISSAVGR